MYQLFYIFYSQKILWALSLSLSLNSSTWLDLCLVDCMDNIISYNKSDFPIAAGHHSISMVISLQIVTPLAKTIKTRPLDNIGMPAGQQLLSEIEWDKVVCNNTDINTNLINFNETFADVIDRIAPMKEIVVNTRKYAPWMNETLKAEAKKVRGAYRKFQRGRKENQLLEYQHARDNLRKAISTARITYYSDKIARTDKGAIWSELKLLGLIGDVAHQPPVISIEELNIYFTSQSTADPYTLINQQLTNFTNIQSQHQLVLQTTTPDTVSNIIKSIKSNAAGHDGISKKMIVLTLDIVVQHITLLINQSIVECNFPPCWKKAIIIPVKKTKSPSLPSDYRQVAVLPFMSKVLERTVYNQTINYLESRKLLDIYQCGFKKSNSTQTALIKLVNDIRAEMDNRRVTILVLFDFSKAFDKVSHQLLLSKMKMLGISDSTLKWYESYLIGRTQAVKGVNGELSSWLPTSTGVPQGSILGPLLFSIFINDIGTQILNSRRILFADDLQIYRSCDVNDINHCISLLNEEIDRISNWANTNLLQLNLNKTQAIIFGARRFINNLNLESLTPLGTIDNVISFSPVVKNLGVLMDSKLTSSQHIQKIISKCNATYYQLHHLGKYTDYALRKTLVMALVYPQVNYCLAVLNGIGLVQDNKLQRIINRGVRFVCEIRRDGPVTTPRLVLGWLSVSNMRKLFLATIIFNTLKNGKPEYLADLLFEYTSARPTRAATGQPGLVVPNLRTDCFMYAFEVSGPRLWNEIPLDIRESLSLEIFKRQLKNWFHSSETSNCPVTQ